MQLFHFCFFLINSHLYTPFHGSAFGYLLFGMVFLIISNMFQGGIYLTRMLFAAAFAFCEKGQIEIDVYILL